jgi:hypothetical protein
MAHLIALLIAHLTDIPNNNTRAMKEYNKGSYVFIKKLNDTDGICTHEAYCAGV